MRETWTRRRILLGGAALLTTACTGRRDEIQPPRSILYTDEPARALGGTSAPASLRYVVQPGDTLAGIARRCGVPMSGIISANRLDSHLISPGQVLVVPGASAVGADPLAERLARRDLLNQAAPEPSRPGTFAIVPRARWAQAAIGKNRQALGAVTRITIHHTGEHPGMVGKSDVQIVQAIDRYHREGKKWAAIGYHYLIGHDGQIFEGRPATIQGAHVSGANEHNLGISCIGDFHRALPPARQLQALHGFLDAQRRRYGVGAARTYGHRDLGQSICPGDALHRWLQHYKARA